VDRVIGAAPDTAYQAGLGTVLREWGRIGCTGFGGPPAHIALLRRLCVDREGWLDAAEFEDAIATCNLLPGPASTELAIFCAWRVRGRAGAVVGGLAFIVPGLIAIVLLAALFLAGRPPLWVRGAGAGADAAVAAVALRAGGTLLTPSWRRAAARDEAAPGRRVAADRDEAAPGRRVAAAAPGRRVAADRAGRARAARMRWVVYLLAGGTAAAVIGPWLVLVLLGCGGLEVALRAARPPAAARAAVLGPALAPAVRAALSRAALARRTLTQAALARGTLTRGAVFPAVGAGLLGSVAWVAVKVGALSFGGGFVIIPLMQADAVGRHWMTAGQFLNAVALGQITPGPVVQTVAAVGYAAAGLPGALLAALAAFTPSFAFVLLGGRHFSRLRGNRTAQSFLDGAGPAAIGAIFGAAVQLARVLTPGWQLGVLAGAIVLLFALRRGVVLTLLAAAATGVIIALAGGPLPR
jgi:chromate transporter